jgi:hypothetical protein
MQPDLRETSWSYGAVARTVPKRRRIWRKLMVAGLLAGSVSLVAVAAPAGAINDPKVPGDNCSSDNSVAVGDPLGAGNPGINFHTPQVSPPVSDNNPGLGSTGAKGQEKFLDNAAGPALAHCFS